MIDHLLRFDDEAAAIADKVVGAYYSEGWRGDVCIPDVSATQVSTGKRLEGWYLNVSSDAPIKGLIEHKAAAFVFDRVAANAGDKFVMLTMYADVDFADLAFEPAFAGSKIPERMDASPKAASVKQRQDWAKTALKDDAVVASEPVKTTSVPAKALAVN